VARTDVRSALDALLSRGAVLLSGACGTEISRRGVRTPLPGWSAAALRTAPDVVRDVHRDHVRAGADVVTANTFRTNRRAVAAAGLGDARDLTKTAVRLAREAAAGAGRPVLVAGSVAPVEDCYRPDLVPDEATLRAEHGIHVGNLVAAGADLALVETMNAVREAVVALRACAAGGLPAAVSFVAAAGGRVLSGEPLADAVAAVRPLHPLAVLVNCCALPVATEGVAAIAGAGGGIPFGAYANGPGLAGGTDGWTFGDAHAPGGDEDHARAAAGWLDLGATWLGGCCGTRPSTVARLRRLIDERRASSSRGRT
jgi:S-methylmethionine-dependent homocysteine/selenocysteine methylase